MIRRLIAGVCGGIAVCANAIETRVASAESSQAMSIVVDSVAFRDDVTRVYCSVLGHPHTSNRIDEATLSIGGIEMPCIDVDGIDMKRYFQWEETGAIQLELDFDATRPHCQFSISLMTVKGAITTPMLTLDKGQIVR
jgi:hypothetical protein